MRSFAASHQDITVSFFSFVFHSVSLKLCMCVFQIKKKNVLLLLNQEEAKRSVQFRDAATCLTLTVAVGNGDFTLFLFNADKQKMPVLISLVSHT